MGAMLAVGAVVSTAIAGDVIRDIKIRDRTISVKGYAIQPIQADVGSWSGVFRVRGLDLSDAATQTEKQKESVRTYLRDGGFDHQAAEFYAPDVTVLYRQNDEGKDTHAIESYIISQSFSIQSDDVYLVSRLAAGVGELIQSGIEFDSYSPSFRFSKLEDWKLKLLGLARENAKKRAEILIGGGGVEVGTVRSASQGVFQITRWDSTSVSSYGSNDTTAIDKNIRAVVTMEYELD